MAITRQDDFVSRAEGEWRTSTERVIAISLWVLRPGHSKTTPSTTISIRSFYEARWLQP
jgi:hypothetical protein